MEVFGRTSDPLFVRGTTLLGDFDACSPTRYPEPTGNLVHSVIETLVIALGGKIAEC
jgi:hypothetical protein